MAEKQVNLTGNKSTIYAWTCLFNCAAHGNLNLMRIVRLKIALSWMIIIVTILLISVGSNNLLVEIRSRGAEQFSGLGGFVFKQVDPQQVQT